MIGLFDDVKFDQAQIDFNPGDRLFTYSDGLFEVYNSNGEAFGIDRVVETLSDSMKAGPGNRLIADLLDKTKEFNAVGELEDDVAILVAEIL